MEASLSQTHSKCWTKKVRNTVSVDQSNLIGTDSDDHINALAYSELDASLSEVWEHRTSPASSAS
ncbi:hypothetical protein PGTUg99_008935 [Puccinia graminis f. sp. tritici]|uniref:Uncharacterized protein n=1 Tax=Puccinia graminis f. sp. tritici TaxID=56615 RepID=A0A5B0NK96_PUCGR|nr:hypothetical protein PGTUg99_008935 [Puccinia graminis f. sp. tritici]